MQSRVTLRDIAEKAGVHHTTVSRALKNDPHICAETLAKVSTTTADEDATKPKKEDPSKE